MARILQGMFGFVLSAALLFAAAFMVPWAMAWAALALWGAVSAARLITIEFEEWLESVFFFGALIGCLTVWLG